jgi:hypothetical protein
MITERRRTQPTIRARVPQVTADARKAAPSTTATNASPKEARCARTVDAMIGALGDLHDRLRAEVGR